MRDRCRPALWVVGVPLAALLFTGCIGAYRVPPVEPGTVASPGPLTEDPEAGLVSVAPGFRLANCVGRSVNLTLRREGTKLVGTLFGAYNLPRTVAFEQAR